MEDELHNIKNPFYELKATKEPEGINRVDKPMKDKKLLRFQRPEYNQESQRGCVREDAPQFLQASPVSIRETASMQFLGVENKKCDFYFHALVYRGVYGWALTIIIYRLEKE